MALRRVIVVVDIDGTLIDSLPRLRKFSLFRHQLAGGTGHWTQEQVDEFLSVKNASQDKPIPGAVEGLRKLLASDNCDVVIMTGRTELARKHTRNLLVGVFGVPDTIPLYMRPETDNRATQICKPEMFEKFVLPGREGPFIFLEDEELVIQSLEKYGVVLRAPECWKALSSVGSGQTSSEESNEDMRR